jgi:nucleoside-diphosphate-sugar epimerase
LSDPIPTISTVFITGATGFIGQHIVSALLQQGYIVRAMVRPQKVSDDRLPAGCEQIPVGLTDVEGLTDIVAACDAVIYCAGSVRGRNPDDFSDANINGVRAMLKALERVPAAPPLLLFSSLAATRPRLSDYAFSKHAGEQLLLDRPSLAWTILRPPAVYGPGDKEMLPVLKMARRGLLVHAAPANQRLSLIHVNDLARAALAWLTAWQQCRHQTYAIDDGRPDGYDWHAIGEAVSDGKYRSIKIPRMMLDIAARSNLVAAKLLSYQPMLTPGKVRELTQADWLGNNSDFTVATGWKPELDLHTGARQLFRAST